eukprot:6045808-Ditylum_brightwellii.AAC.1
MNVSHGALECFSVCPPSAEVFFPPVDTNEETRIDTEIDEFMSELNGEEVEMNLDARRILTTATAPSSKRKSGTRSKNINIKDWALVMDLMKALTKNHVKKSETFTKKQICSIAKGCAVDDSPKVRLMGVGNGVSYFGLLCTLEILLVNVENIMFNTEKNVYQ